MMATRTCCSPSLDDYYKTPFECERIDNLLRLVPRNRASLLDVGGRDGHLTAIMLRYFGRVAMLDLKEPKQRFAGIAHFLGDACEMPFSDRSFDVVMSTETIEHIPRLRHACDEMKRVARHEILIGVPYRQDARYGQNTCPSCGRICPPWGHLNRFDEARLTALFAPWEPVAWSYVGSVVDQTNAISATLMTWAGNPFGTARLEYGGCVYCGAKLDQPKRRWLFQRACSRTAHVLTQLQRRFCEPHAISVHVLFRRGPAPTMDIPIEAVVR
jgi:SAM-dependent methyltransferase